MTGATHGQGQGRAGRSADQASPGSEVRVRELMKRASTVVPGSATVAEAIRLLTAAHVGGAPVVTGEHVVGVVTLADLHRWVAEPDPDQLEEPARALRSHGMRLDRVAVDRLLPRLAIKAHDDWTAGYALAVLTRAGIQRLPVVDDVGRLVGIIAREGLLAAGIEPPAEGGAATS
jgi:CBS domain-containing protein